MHYQTEAAQQGAAMQPTAKQMIPAIGQDVLLIAQDLRILCIVRDVKTAYGTVQVEPVAGDGLQWVQMERITLNTMKKIGA